MKSVLITGGLGYIGSHIAVELLNSEDPYFIVIIDNLSNSSIEMEAIIKQNKIKKNENTILFFQIDMTNLDDLTELFSNIYIDIVIHLAGYKSVNESVKDPTLYYTNNLVSTLHLIQVMKENNCKNLIFSSSSTVYGNSTPPYNETSLTGIGLTNPYGKTKYMQEEILKDLYVSDNEWNIVLLRYFNPISQLNNSLKEKPNGIPNNLFPYIVKVYHQEIKQLQIYGTDYNTPDGTCVRDFIHVADLANGHIKVCESIIANPNIGLKIYNLGTGKGISVKELIDTFEKVNSTQLNIQYTERRQGDLEISYADASLANRELGWKTKYTIEEMVQL